MSAHPLAESVSSGSASSDGGDAAPPGARSARTRLIVLLVLVAAAVAAVSMLPVRSWLAAAVDWTEGLGVWGPVVLAGLYVVATVLFVPGSIITLGAGALFGPVVGSIAVFAGATAGSTAAFLVGRHLARAWVARKVEGSERFAAIDRAVGREGLKIVLLTRLSPVFPFNLLNYAYGLTGVRLRDYVIGCLGMIPGTILYVYLGSAGKRAADAVAAGEIEAPDGSTTGEQVFFWAGLIVAAAVTVFVTRVARRALDEEVEEVDLAGGDAPAAKEASS